LECGAIAPLSNAPTISALLLQQIQNAGAPTHSKTFAKIAA